MPPPRSRRRTTPSPASRHPSKATNIRLRFLAGKGGVGKTTCAAAIAIAEARRGARTLVLSTDPAPSLGHALGRRLSDAPRAVPIPRARATLHAAEVDAAPALERWLATRRTALERIALRGTWLDEQDVARLLRLSLPGIDELASLLELARLSRTGGYDLIVVDTAPTGHTLRMLAMPGTLLAVAHLFDRMQEKHRVVVEALRGRWQPDRDDRVIAEMAQQAEELAATLRDPSKAATSLVSLAEPMAIEETLDAAHALEELGLAVDDIILNRLTPPPPSPCRWCAARRAFERGAAEDLLRRIGSRASAPAVRTLAARDAEPIGIRALGSIAADLQSPRQKPQKPQKPQKGAASFPGKEAAPFWRGRAVAAVSDLARKPRRAVREEVGAFAAKVPASLVMFGGKGGVGKTTCAAAAGLAAALEEPRRRVLLISTDPAHSLADAVGVRLGDTPRRLPGGPRNLLARELNAAEGFDRIRHRYRDAIDGFFERMTRGSSVDLAQDRRVMQDLIDLAPPGVDELAAVIEVVDTLEGDRAPDLLIVDTAPSGHALRLLEMPAVVQEWTRALMSILLKYQPIAGIGDLGAVLLELSRGIGRLRERLGDAARTRFVVVTRAAALPRAESIRLVARLSRLGIHAPTVVVNAVGAGTCARCRRQRTAEAREVVRLRRDLTVKRQRAALVAAPARMPPPHGPDDLFHWRRAWQTLS